MKTIPSAKLADLIVLSDDPLTVPAEKLKDLQVDATIIDGVVRYERSGHTGTP